MGGIVVKDIKNQSENDSMFARSISIKNSQRVSSGRFGKKQSRKLMDFLLDETNWKDAVDLEAIKDICEPVSKTNYSNNSSILSKYTFPLGTRSLITRYLSIESMHDMNKPESEKKETDKNLYKSLIIATVYPLFNLKNKNCYSGSLRTISIDTEDSKAPLFTEEDFKTLISNGKWLNISEEFLQAYPIGITMAKIIPNNSTDIMDEENNKLKYKTYFANRAYLEMTECTKEEVEKKDFILLKSLPVDHPQIYKIHRELNQSQEVKVGIRYQRKDHLDFFKLLSIKAVYNFQTGEISQLVGIHFDVTASYASFRSLTKVENLIKIISATMA